MQTPFQLPERPPRPQPLQEAPAGYFDQLPTRVMSRLPRPEARASAGSWWVRWPLALRAGLASTAALTGVAATLWLGRPDAAPPASAVASAALDAVPRRELVSYLLTSGVPVETADLALLTAADPDLSSAFLRPSATELDAALDEQPADAADYL